MFFFDFNPVNGHEQGGKRPAIVISTNIFNKNSKMVILCPITSNTKDYPTHYLLEDTKKVKGSVLCEHIRSTRYDARKLKFIESASENDLLSVMMLTNACMDE